MKKILGFTLAEIMIVLVVIGVLSAILLPVAINSTPNEDVMKFKKGHNALLSAIRELVNSDKYYLDGDLGVKVNGEYVVKKDYFLRSLADVINIKNAQFPANENGSYCPDTTVTDQVNRLSLLDSYCLDAQSKINSYLQTNENIFFYQAVEECAFGAEYDWLSDGSRNPFYVKWDGEGSYMACTELPTIDEQNECVRKHTEAGFYFVHQAICMDIDGINEGEPPFGYGIRIDGKVLIGARANEWLQKSIQEKE